MSNAADPQNDRELLLNLNTTLNEKLPVLTKSIDTLSTVIKHLEEKKVASLESQVKELIEWKQQILGGWKLALAIWVIIGAGVAGLISAFLKR